MKEREGPRDGREGTGAAKPTGPFQKLLLKGGQEESAVSQAHLCHPREGEADDHGDGDEQPVTMTTVTGNSPLAKRRPKLLANVSSDPTATLSDRRDSSLRGAPGWLSRLSG